VNPTCRYCNSIVNERASYCQSCKKFLI
jgi:RNA polymerase subunit RPABC4/transcription elongation factor Spt4